MRANFALLTSLLLARAAAGIIDPEARSDHVARAEAEVDADTLPDVHLDDEDLDLVQLEDFEDLDEDDDDEEIHTDLAKRRGGGGGGGRGGSSGGGSKSGGSSRGSSSSGSRGSSSSSRSSGKGTNTKGNSNVGGYSKGGTGPQPSFPGGRYAGGAKVPFKAGAPAAGGLVAGAAIGGSALAFWPGHWAYPVYMYGPYGYHYAYHNKTSKKDEKREIQCGCEQYSVCMCDEVDDKKFWDKLIGDGDYSKLNKSVVTVSKVNKTETILINGTLPNGTTVNSDDPEDYEKYLTNAAARLGQVMGVVPVAAVVMGAVYLM